MSHVHIDRQAAPHRIQIVVRQSVGPVLLFVLFVVVVGAAASSRGRELGVPLEQWAAWPVGLGALAAAWGVYAMFGEERYVFDRGAGTYALLRRTPLGTRAVAAGPLGELRAARAAWVGYDDSVRGVELLRLSEPPLALPLRITGLSEAEQLQLAALLSTVLAEGALGRTMPRSD